MPKRIFQPGCRLSRVDILVLIVGVIASGYAATVDRRFGIAIGFVILHFFLFCNILRMSRPLEIAWAGFLLGWPALRPRTSSPGPLRWASRSV